LARERARTLSLAQGVFFTTTGLWPILHLRSFEAVTGPKPEGWLVKTVGALLTVVGAGLLVSSRRAVTRESALVAAGSAAALAAVDVWYAGVRRRISPVYLVDAPIELSIALGWVALRRGLT
jgi:hypothetical protein